MADETTPKSSRAGRPRCLLTVLVDKHFAGQITPADEARMRAHLPDCASCHHRYERHLLLGHLTGAGPSPADRLAIGLGLQPPSVAASRARAMGLTAAGLAAAAALALVVSRSVWMDASVDGFTARSGSVTAAAASELQIFGVKAEGDKVRSALAGARVTAGEDLGFAYSNPAGYTYLMVLAVDERGEVLWFHPAWTDGAQDPKAVAITAGAPPRELPDPAQHRLHPGRLRVMGLFLHQPLTVKVIEARLRAGQPAVQPREGTLTERVLEVSSR